MTDPWSALYLDPDAFLLPGDGEETLLYAPLVGFACSLNPAAARWLRPAEAGEALPVPPEVSTLAAQLASLGVLRAERPLPRRPLVAEDHGFAPTSASLFLTAGCNLRCGYCHAEGGERSTTLDPQAAHDVVRLLVANAHAQGTPRIGLSFHGGGEPTLAFPLLRAVSEDARSEAARARLGLTLSLGTNGVMPREHAEWLAAHLTSATVSLDGPAALHDRQRPLRDGGGSHEPVRRTLACFDAAGLDYGLRATITREGVSRLPEIVDHLCATSRARWLKLEPLFVQGRAARHGLEPPDPRQFVAGFLEGRELAARRGRRLVYSGLRLDVTTDRFCAAAGRSFCLTPDLHLTSCYEVTDERDPRAALFFFGRYDPGPRRFDVDPARLARQRRLTLLESPACRRCFARWHCAGDCPAKTAGTPRPGPDALPWRTFRCEITRELTRRELLERLRTGPDLLPPPAPPAPSFAPAIAAGCAGLGPR